MAHIVKNTDRWVIDVDTNKGFVFLQMKWKYTWVTAAGQSAWTYQQRKEFHTKVDKSIWRTWSYKVKLKVTGDSHFAKAFRTRMIPINLDVKWVTSTPHWQVTVTKIPPGGWQGSEVLWNDRKIILDTEDVNTDRKCVDVPHAGFEDLWKNLPDGTASNGVVKSLLTSQVCSDQLVISHEFGHAAGNTWVKSRGDEYRRSSDHLTDTGSMLNIGNKLRERHFRTILEDLNTMIPDCTFSVGTIRT